jgi:hypothetical protein
MDDSSEELLRQGFDRVHVENDRYDGPWSGVADIHGVPHYFYRVNFDDRYFVWPVDDETLALEREQWMLYYTWLRRYHAGETRRSHPSESGDVRWDELQVLLKPRRIAPNDARVLRADWQYASDLDGRVTPEGPDYLVRWSEPA